MQQVLELAALCFQALHLLPKHALHLLQRLHASMGLRDSMTYCNCILLMCTLTANKCCKPHFAYMQYLHLYIADMYNDGLQTLQAVLCTYATPAIS